jgi:outer membrane receptor protein involved in Fe transport
MVGAAMAVLAVPPAMAQAAADAPTPPAASASVPAAGKDPAAPQQVLVTANRRAQTVQDVSASVSALSGDDLQRQGVDNFERLAERVPGLTANTLVKNRSVFNIRGVATAVFGGSTQDPVGVYINDAPVGESWGASVTPDLRLFDVDRIEVLRGPQGTLYGSGALSGVVKIITNLPQLRRFEAAGQVELAHTEGGGLRQRYDAMLNVPLIDNVLGLRAVVYYRDEAGWVKNTQLGTENSTVDHGGRLALRWKLLPTTTLNLTGIYQKSKPEDSDGWNPALGKFQKASPLAEGRPLTYSNLSATLDHEVPGAFTLSSITTSQKSSTEVNSYGGPIPGLGDLINRTRPYEAKFLSQEFRAVSSSGGPLSWVVGAFFMRRDVESHYNTDLVGIDNLVGGALGSDNVYRARIKYRSRETAAYADLTYAFTPAWSAFGGLRKFSGRTDYDEDGQRLSFATFTFEPYPYLARAKDSGTTWRLGGSFKPAPQTLAYGSVSTGYRIGQFNIASGASATPDPTNTVIPVGYKPDKTLNYELGVKTALGRQLEVSAALYYIDWTDIQLNFQRASDFASYVDNGGKAVSKGLELSVVARPMAGLELGGNLTLQDAKVTQVSADLATKTGLREGDRLPGSVKSKAMLYAQLTHDFANGFGGYTRISANQVGKSPNFFPNYPGGSSNASYTFNDSYRNVDLSFGLNKDLWQAVLYVENLSNNSSYIVNASTALPNPVTTLRPRTVGIKVNVSY